MRYIQNRHCEEALRPTGQSRLWIASSLLLLAITLFSLTASAQEDGEDPTLERRYELSEQMHEIWPVRPKVENALNVVARQAPEDERLAFKAAMRKAIQFDKLEEESIEAMADIFTVEELEAMVAFYGSPEGRSVSEKTDDYQAAIRPVIARMMDGALLDVRTGNVPGNR